MDHSLSTEQQFFADTIRRFLESKCPTSRVRQIADGASGFDDRLWKEFTDLGWSSLLAEEAYGGAALGPESYVYLGIVAEESGRLIQPGPVHSTVIASTVLSLPGNEQLKQQYLPGIITGSCITAWAVDNATGDWANKESYFEVTPSSEGFHLRGSCLCAEAVPLADLFLVSTHMDGKPAHFLVPASTPGVSVEPQAGLDITRRYGTVHFNCEVASTAQIQQLDDKATDKLHALALVLQALDSTGAMQKVFEFTLEWAFDRYSFGRPLASYQALKHRYADMKVEVEACQATAWAALHAIANDQTNAAQLARVANAYVSLSAPEVVQDCIQMHGGIGVTWEHDIHLYLRRVTANSVLYGNHRQHKEAISLVILEKAS